ncbi:MAG: CBS domain-containing protein [Clostridia bacterium]|nr:CBS domain-containing protein [Clostridia bacterium]MBR6744818.1 CBS domain-containing protein [Clostridia bacterium]
MNIASFLIPRSMVTYLYDDCSVRQALEKMKYHGRKAVPVITRDNRYVGTLSDGDLLWYLTDYMKNSEKNKKSVDFRDLESVFVRDFLCKGKNPPVRIGTSYCELVERAIEQNFIPVIDDRDSFIGIVTRKSVIRRLSADLKQVQYEKLFDDLQETDYSAVNSK